MKIANESNDNRITHPRRYTRGVFVILTTAAEATKLVAFSASPKPFSDDDVNDIRRKCRHRRRLHTPHT